jgi:hypothetical protein
MLTIPNFNGTQENMRYTAGILPSLDGWRALSVVLVLFAHSHPPQALSHIAFLCGAIGVKFFFVISGFLITWLLLREQHTQGTIDLVAHGDQARENLTFRNPCKFKDCHFLVRFKRGLRLRIPLW